MKKYKTNIIEQNICFKPYLLLAGNICSRKKIDYAQLRPAKKPAVNFLKPAINQKKCGLWL